MSASRVKQESAEHVLAKAILCTNRGTVRGLAIWESWNDQQRDEAASVAANFSPILSKLSKDLSLWADEV